MKKACTQCGAEFDTVDRSPKAKTCSKKCSREYKREYASKRWATDPEYRERERERNRKRWATDPEYRERYRERNREYHREIAARCRIGRLLAIQDQLRRAMARRQLCK